MRNTRNQLRGTTISRSGTSSGMAMVLVLIVLVLLCGLVTAIFFMSQISRQSSSLFADSVETRFLADTGVNLCMAQIADATSQPNRAWVSQPGLIRTFTGNRVSDWNYRLYSWSAMRSTGDFNPFSEDNAVSKEWKQQKALYVDLNEPVPDPSAPEDLSRDKYPILYPPALTGTDNSSSIAGFKMLTNETGATENAAPMPVQWLYVLKDGSVKPATAISNDEVRVEGATSKNPIAGRIAFWADDESAKVNINTAAGGLFWTEPRFQTVPDEDDGGRGMGFTQPTKGEYQRYPGHPSRTDLRAVFPELTWNEIYQIAPRVTKGGSENGTVLTATSSPIVTDLDRLFTSPGELRFSASKSSASADRDFQTKNFVSNIDSALWTTLLEKRKAFITATSRSPELTLFGTPRIAIWPINTTDDAPGPLSYRSALDRLIAFCSTITSGANNYSFYFVRQNSKSESVDISLDRNQGLIQYFQRLTNSPFPGVSGAAFSTKYGGKQGCDQILTEIFDYIRCTNLQDMQLDASRYFSSNAIVVPTRKDLGHGMINGFGRSLTVRQAGFLFICNADGSVPESNRPPGAPEIPGHTEIKQNLALDNNVKLQSNERRIQGLFLIELFSPSAGFKSYDFQPFIRVKGLDTVSVNGIQLNFPGNDVAPVPKCYLGSYPGGFGSDGGTINYRWLFMAGNKVPRGRDVVTTGGLEGSTGGYPFVSFPVTIAIDPNNPTMTLDGGSVTVEIYADSAETQLLGKAKIDIGPLTLPPPRLHPGYGQPGHPAGKTIAADSTIDTKAAYWAFQKKGIFGGNAPSGRFGEKTAGGESKAVESVVTTAKRMYADQAGLITWYDTVQTWILPHGDYRMLFGLNARQTQFAPTPAGEFSNLRHCLADFLAGVIGYNTGATYASGINFRPYWAPAMLSVSGYPSGINSPWNYGDWDTAVPVGVTDGALINKTDEGSLYQSPGTNTNPYILEQGRTSEGDNKTRGLNYHSANRQVPSAVMFGSLPTGMITGDPWQTLLFRPAPSGHPGADDPPDHLLLDLFWMPIVEPYAISEPFSTAGKINMNYQMIPFTWIQRDTGIRAILQDEKLLAVSDSTWTDSSYRDSANMGYAKKGGGQSMNPRFDLALPLNVEETLAPFRSKFTDGKVFLTPSEITTVPLVPEGETSAGMDAFWKIHRLTGDNLRERPYAHIYPRLTTRSNVFNIHYRVQVLRKNPKGDPGIWNAVKDNVAAEFRGSTLIERYIDMKGANIPDFATNPTANAESLYRFRVLSSKDFNP